MRKLNNFTKRFQFLTEREQGNKNIIASRFGINRSMFYKLLNGTTKYPQNDTVKSISDGAGCDFNWLKSGIGEPFPDENQLSTTTSPKKQIAKNRSKFVNSEGDMTNISGSGDSLKLSALERAAIEMNRNIGSDASLLEFMQKLSEQK